jgi:hypothetical protein
MNWKTLFVFDQSSRASCGSEAVSPLAMSSGTGMNSPVQSSPTAMSK